MKELIRTVVYKELLQAFSVWIEYTDLIWLVPSIFIANKYFFI